MEHNLIQKTLAEFEKRYTGRPADTESICEEIAFDWRMDPEEVKEIVYIWRYE